MGDAYFISLEGIDGSGKTTMQQMLEQHLLGKGFEVLVTYEPGGSKLGKDLRKLLLDTEGMRPEARTEALLFAAERAAHVDEVIRPALFADKIVLCDRFCDSTIAYQGGGRGLSIAFLQQLNLFATGGLMPDLSFFFDLPLETARARQNRQKDRLEQEDAAFYKRIITAYHRLAEEERGRIRVINAAQPLKAVFTEVLRYLPHHLR